MKNWSTPDIPSQRGRTAVITGTGGIGFEAALALAHAGGEIILAGRNAQKGAEAVSRILEGASRADIRFEQVDLADLSSVAAFAARLHRQTGHLDLLINNAGVMTPKTRIETADGLELQFGTNYLGHFALTAHLLPLLKQGRAPRIVTVSSIAAREGRIDFDNLHAERAYSPVPIYAQSKLACLIFALELQRRSDAQGWGLTSLAAHPGVSRTDLLPNAPGGAGFLPLLLRPLFQPAWKGALPILFAATAPEAKPGGYYGCSHMAETRGFPAPARIPAKAQDEGSAHRLWATSEALTGVTFNGARPPALLPA
ncbi:oxidoreductase [Hyphomonas sp.]|uniref:oxidoreductase n=1 Tax=Hyphomonas sp. TaxID=87 RepID=UPI003918A450